jgi:hemerythrin
MSLFVWRDAYSIHHSEIDRQHRHLFKLADDLHAAMITGSARAVIAETLDALIQYTRDHFRSEEAIMQAARFPDYSRHKAIHDKFTSQVMELRKSLGNDKLTITLETMHFLRDWLQEHILGLDQQIADHVARSKAPGPRPLAVGGR